MLIEIANAKRYYNEESIKQKGLEKALFIMQ